MSGNLVPVAQPSAEPASTPAPQHRWGDDDPDVIALREAQAEAAGTTAEPPAADQGAATQPPAQVPPAAPAPAAATPASVPYARFRELNQTAQRQAEEIAYWRGVAEARAQQPAAPAQQQQQQAPAFDPIAEIRAGEAALLEAVTKWEQGGEMSAVELETARMHGLTRILNARDHIFASRLLQVVAERVDAALARPGMVDSHALEAQIATLEAKHPWLKVMTDEDIAALEELARTEANARRQPFPAGPAGLAKLRQRVAELSGTYGPQWYPGTTPPAPAAAPTATPNPSPTAPPTSGLRPTPEQVRDNLARQAAHPPNDPTGRASGDVTLTPERLDGMTDEQIEDGVPTNRLREVMGLPPRR